MGAWLDRPASTDSVAGLLLETNFCPPVLGDSLRDLPSAERTIRIRAGARERQLSINHTESYCVEMVRTRIILLHSTFAS